jgi:type I restriction enzyme, S subunit
MLPRGWKWAKLGNPNVASLIMGQSPPGSSYNKHGKGLPFYQGKADFGDLYPVPRVWCTEPERIAEVGDILMSVRAPVGPTNVANEECCIGRGLSAIRAGPAINSFFLLYWMRFVEPRIASRGQGSTFHAIGRDDLASLDVPIPPLLVQQWIIEILQKADSIRRKRQEALRLADTILSSTFMEMFGNLRENPQDFKVTPLSELADVRSGVTKGRKLGSKETVEIPYLRVANVQDGYLDLSEVRTIEVLPQDIERYRLEDGDILMIEGCGNPNYLGRGSIWQDQIPGCIHQNHIFRVRTNRGRLLPDFLASLLRTKYANGYFLACAKNSSGLSNINSTQVKAFPVPEPPLALQQKFVSAVRQWGQINKRLTDGLMESKRLFEGLIQQVFTGALTAAWEAMNADEIAAEQTRRERLPRLVLLDFVRERQRRRRNEPVLITSLMKYVFLLQKEGTTGQALYHFVPYKYGPFARELYQDLEALAADGFITVTETDEERTEIAIVPSKETMVQRSVAELPEDLQADIAAVVEQYGDLAHHDLLATVYQKFPAYATKSRLRHYQSR